MSIPGLFGGLKYLPASLGIKALQKINPKFKNFFASAAAYGIDTNRALNYLTDRFESDSQRAYKNQLDRADSQGSIRPDEAASRAQISNQEIPGRVLKSAASIISGGLLGGGGEDEEQEENKLQGPHIPSMDQLQAPNVPQNPRVEATRAYNERQKKKRTMQQQLEEDVQRQSKPEYSIDDQLLLAMQNILKM